MLQVLNRRELAAGCAASLALSAFHAWPKARPRSERIKVGTQTNTFGVPIKEYDRLLEILDILARLGYAAFETSYMSLEPHRERAAECRKAFESRRVRLLAPHTSGRLWERAKHAEEIERLRAIAGWSAQMGATHFIISGARLPHVDGKLDQEAARAKAEGMNRVGEACRKEGLKLCYHTHISEFEDTPPEIGILLRETDPKLVWLNYDIGNAYGIGPDPAKFSAENARRIAVYHLKDVMPGPAGKPVSTDLGAGKIDLKAVVAPLLDSDWEGWLVVEREGQYPKPAENPEQSLRQCRQYIREITGV